MAKRLKPILAVFRKSDGEFLDSEDSFARGASQDEIIEGPNVMGKHGGNKDDYICVPIDEVEVHLFKYEDQRLVEDDVKVTELLVQMTDEMEKSSTMDSLKAKLKDDTITFEELKQLLVLVL